jgi:hypothetical protein
MDGYCRWQGEDLYLRCHLQPKASRDEIAGLHGDSVKIRITAPPVEGRANAHLVKFLAKLFGVTRRDVVILSGELGREKRIRIHRPSKLPDTLDFGATETD